MTLNEISYSALGVEERSDEAPRGARGWANADEPHTATSNRAQAGTSAC